jgi:hypothetical protein
MSTDESSERGGSRVKPFNGVELAKWPQFRGRMEAYLDGLNIGMLEFMMEELLADASPMKLGSEKKEKESTSSGSATRAMTKERTRLNWTLYSKLILHTDGAPSGVVEQFQDTRDGMGAWQALIAKYEVKGHVQKGILLEQLITRAPVRGADPDVYFIEVERLVRQLNLMKVRVDETLTTVIVLSKLSEEYSGLQTVLDTMEDLTYEQLKAQVRIHHRRKKAASQDVVNQDAALLTTAREFKGKCHDCGVVGHKREACPKRGTDDQKERGNGWLVCGFCGKPGHAMKYCRAYKATSGNDGHAAEKVCMAL